jgi:hypothetical protein
VIVSHRQHKRLNGPLHADSNYAIVQGNGKIGLAAKIRKPLESLSDNEISSEAIVDSKIRELVRSKFAELRNSLGISKQPKEVFASPENHPTIPNHDGSSTRIHSVRIWTKAKPQAIRKNDATRNITSTSGSNFCTKIMAIVDSHGNEIGWTDELLTRLDAMQRKSIEETNPLERFSLFIHEHVALLDAMGNWQICRVINLSEGEIGVQLHHDGRKSDEIKKAKERIRIGPGILKERGFRKVVVSPTGLLSDALTGTPIDIQTLEKPPASNQTKVASKRKKKD